MASDKTPTIEELETVADDAWMAAEAFHAAMAARRQEFENLLVSGADVDPLQFRQKADADSVELARLKLKAARAALAYEQACATEVAAKNADELVKLRAIESQVTELQRQLQKQRGAHSKANGVLENHRLRIDKLQSEISDLQKQLLSAVDGGRVSAMRPVPAGYNALS